MTVDAHGDGADGYADLAGGDVAVERLAVLDERHEPDGAAVPGRGQLGDAGPARSHGGKLGGDVQRVKEDQNADDGDDQG